MKTIGLTGCIGGGKSTVAEILRRHGVPAVDSDDLAREVVAIGQPALEDIRRAFGDRYLNQDGSLRRSALAQQVFRDTESRRALEAILHPGIQRRWQERVTRWKAEGNALGVVVIPLLFEKSLEAHFTVTVCVGCSLATQLQRLSRRGWTAEEIQQRLSAQFSTPEKMDRAERVLWNEGTLAVLADQVRLLLAST